MKIESLKKDELVNYCKSLNIITVKKTKIELINAIYTYRRDKIDKAIASKTDTTLLKLEIQKIADEYAFKLNEKITNRKSEMKSIVENIDGKKPKTFEIDFLNGNKAIELKWRDATTDGDHITKEHTRVRVIKAHGYIPVRVMFYAPQREQAIKIQETLKTLYDGIGGEYYAGIKAWEYLKEVSGYDLKSILEEIAMDRDDG